MRSDKRTELLETILKVFPHASIIQKSEPNSFAQGDSKTNGIAALAKLANSPRVNLRACKHKVLPGKQQSLFDETE